MRLTTKGRYAVTAMLDLALHAGDGPVCLGDISRRQEISLSYLEQLFTRLRRNGLVASVRGPGGGYRLRRLFFRIRPDQMELNILRGILTGTQQVVEREKALREKSGN